MRVAADGLARRFSGGWLGGLGCGALIMVEPATALFLVVLLAPSALMRIADDRPERSGALAVLLCNVAATIGPLVHLWQEAPPGLARAIDQLSAITVIAWAWLAAGLGWLVSECLIFLAARWLARRDERAKARLTEEIDELVGEWGEVKSL